MKLAADRGLQARMLLTLFLLGLVYVVLIVVLISAGVGATMMLILMSGLVLAQLFLSDKIALRAMGARTVSPQEAPQLHAMVERLCIQADMPKPTLAVADTAMPNAFAMGRSPASATVCVTTGIMHILSPAELEGVIAHELAHIQHRDVLLMTIASFFASVAAMIMQWGFIFGGGHHDSDDEGPGFLAVLLVATATYMISFFLMMALSRYREFSADRGAALLTGRPSALASALMRLDSGMDRIPNHDLRASQQMNAFFIVPAVKGLFATHPSMDKRIAALQEIEAQMQASKLLR